MLDKSLRCMPHGVATTEFEPAERPIDEVFVSVVDGIVTLAGTVWCAAARDAAGAAVRRGNGILDVVNGLVVE